MRGFLKFLEGIVLFGLAIIFVKWSVKGLFGRYFYIFWIWLIVAIGMVVHDRATQEPYDNRTGAEFWEERYGKVR